LSNFCYPLAVVAVGLRIGELARRTGTGTSALRAWERRFGLLQPERTAGGQRLYAEADVERVAAVKKLVAEGLTLASASARVTTAGSGALPAGEDESLLLHQVVQLVDQGIWVSVDGRTRYVNRKMASLMGCSIDELMTRPVLDFVEDDAVESLKERGRLGRRGAGQHYEMTLRRADGSTFLAEVSTTPLIDASGTYEGAVAVVNDITERSRTLAEAQLRSALLDAIGEAVLASLPDGTITYANPASERLFGWKVNELIGQNGLEMLPSQATASSALDVHAQLLSGEPISGPLELTRRDGSQFVARITGAPVRGPQGNLVGLTAVLVDDSERDQLKQQDAVHVQQIETIAMLGSSALRSTTDHANAVIEEIVEATRRMLGAESAALFELSADGVGFRARATSPPLTVPDLIPAGSRSLTGYTALVGRAVLVDDVQCDRRFDLATGSPVDVVSAVAAPVTSPHNVVAVLVAGSSRAGSFDKSSVHVVQSMANAVGFVLLLGRGNAS
jgi:PAS domain S-box-containing protein